jgi:uncharacterized membrane protein YidH (DUF202 family)
VTNLSFEVIVLAPSSSAPQKPSKCGIHPLVGDISARQRTFEAAYWRTAIGQFSFALTVLSIFQSVFYSIGGKPVSPSLTIVLYAVYAILMVCAATYRRALSNTEFFADGHGRYFRTSGRIVGMTMIMSLGMYVILLVLLFQIP